MSSRAVLSAVVASILIISCNSISNNRAAVVNNADGPVVQMTTESFKKLIYNYDKNSKWKYEGTQPAIVDFYADWCAPCRELSKLVEEVATEYGDKIVVYRVNTDQEKQLTEKIGVSGLPTLVFIPADGKPQFTVGYIPKETLKKAIKEVLLIN